MSITPYYYVRHLTHYNKLSILTIYADDYKDPNYITVQSTISLKFPTNIDSRLLTNTWCCVSCVELRESDYQTVICTEPTYMKHLIHHKDSNILKEA